MLTEACQFRSSINFSLDLDKPGTISLKSDDDLIGKLRLLAENLQVLHDVIKTVSNSPEDMISVSTCNGPVFLQRSVCFRHNLNLGSRTYPQLGNFLQVVIVTVNDRPTTQRKSFTTQHCMHELPKCSSFLFVLMYALSVKT